MGPNDLSNQLIRLAISIEIDPSPSRLQMLDSLKTIMNSIQPSNYSNDPIPTGLGLYLAEISGRANVPFAGPMELFARELLQDISKRWGGSGVINELKDQYK